MAADETSKTVFLSYSRDTRPYAQAVADALRRRGVTAWIDERDPRAGQSLTDELHDALRSAAWLVVFISTDGLRSPWVNFEIGAALGQNKRLLTIFLSDIAFRDAPPHLQAAQSIKAYDRKPDEIADEIAGTVRAAA